MNYTTWEQRVRKVEPYTPGEQPKTDNVIKLNTNENPFPPSPMVEKVIKEYNEDALRLYPDTRAGLLVDALAKRYGVDSDQVFVGVGSDDVISQTFLTFFNSDKEILFPDITYSFYDVWADLYRIPYRTVPLKDDFTINPDDYKCDNGGIIIPNPNAPTGVLESLDTIDKYENLLVVQTFSKSRSMAGMRIGFAIGSKKLIKYLSDVKFSVNSYTMNPLSVIGGAAAVEDEEYYQKTTQEIINTREYSKKRLTELGFTFPDSMSNFIFASHKKVPAKEIFTKLKEQGIYVRYWDKPRINNHLRISIGTKENMDKVFEKLAEIVG